MSHAHSNSEFLRSNLHVVKSDLHVLQAQIKAKHRNGSSFNDEQKEMLLRKIETINKDLTDSINYARRIQHAILPEESIMTGFSPQSFVFYKPKSIVSGDFYWFNHYENKLLVASVDCTGHGVPGAFMSMIGHNLLNEIVNVKDITQPAEILNRLDRSLRKLLKQDRLNEGARDGMDVSVCSIDSDLGIVEFAGANRPVILIGKDGMQYVSGDKFPIGGLFMETEMKFTNHIIKAERGTRLYMYSDGITDQFGGDNNKKLMGKRFRQLLQVVYSLNANQQKKIIKNFMEEWQGDHEQTDDMLLIGITV